MSAIPNSSKYEHSTLRPESMLSRESHMRACKQFDARMHGLMTYAENKTAWLKILYDMLAAHALSYKESQGLRPKVREHFLADCPHEDILFRFKQEAGSLELPDRRGISPLRQGRKKEDRRIVDARRAANRNTRHSQQPMRGSSSGGGQQPGKQKGGKKN